MKLLRNVGATSQILQVFIQDSSSTTGDGLTGLAFNTAGLTAYFHRDTGTTATAISLVTMTVGTFTSSGFREVDSTNQPGVYQLCPPNAALASGASSVVIFLKGATNMAQLPIEIDLNPQVASLAPAALNLIAVTDPGAPATTFPSMLVQVWRRFFKKTILDTVGNTLKTYADDGTTVDTTQAATNSAGVQTQGAAS